MKKWIAMIACSLLLTGCGTKYQYQAQQNPQQWMGKNISALQSQWGVADQTFETRTNGTYYVYNTNSSANFFRSTTTNFSSTSGLSGPLNNRGNLGLECTTIFKTNENGVITAVSHQGHNCGGEWVPANGTR